MASHMTEERPSPDDEKKCDLRDESDKKSCSGDSSLHISVYRFHPNHRFWHWCMISIVVLVCLCIAFGKSVQLLPHCRDKP